MASFGDNYTYSVDVKANGFGVFRQSERLINEFAKAQRAAAATAELWVDAQGKLRNRMGQFATDAQRTAAAAGHYGAEIQQAAVATDRLGNSARRAAADVGQSSSIIAAAGQRIGHGLTQATYIMDDMAYGARGLRNNILPLSTALLGFGAAGAIVGAAGTVLVGVFSKQIDQALAYAGILDENLVKGMERAKRGTEDLTEATDINTEAAKRNADAARDQAIAFLAVADATTTAARKAAGDIAGQFGGQNLRNALVKSLEEAFVDAGRMLTDFNKAQVQKQADAIIQGLQSNNQQVRDWAQGELAALAQVYDDVFAKFGVAFEGLFAQLNDPAAKGAPDLVKDMQAAADEAEKLKKSQEERKRSEKQAILDRLDAAKEAFDLEQRRLDLVNQIAEAERQAEEERLARIANRREAEARANLDATTRRVIDAFGPGVQGGIRQGLQAGLMRGQGVDEASNRVFADLSAMLQRMGVGGGAADQAARQLVDEQARQFQAMVDANNAQAMMQREMLGGMQLILNLYNQQRADALQGMQQAQAIRDQAARNAIRRRANGLGTFRPF